MKIRKTILFNLRRLIVIAARSTHVSLLLIGAMSCTSSNKKYENKNIFIKKNEELHFKRAIKIIKNQNNFVTSLLQPTFDPYRGEISLPIACQKENLPSPVTQSNDQFYYTFLSFYSSNPKQLGNCIDDKSLLKTQYLQIYCKNRKTLYQVKYFYQKSQPWLTKPIVNCKDL